MFISRIKSFFVSDFVRVSFLSGLSAIIRMITGLISVKIVASKIGPIGVALLGQLTNFATIIQAISAGGINAGVTKYISENSNSPEVYKRFLGTSFWVTVVFSIVCSLVMIFGASYFSQLILHDVQYRSVFYIFGITLIFYSLNALLLSVINGFKEYKRFVVANIMGSIVGLIFSIILTLAYGIPGALISSITFQSVVFILTLKMVSKTDWFRWRSFIKVFSKKVVSQLSHYSLMALASAITIPAGQLLVRSFIAKEHSIDEAGIWEGVNKISMMYLNIVTLSLSVYYLPRLAELKTRHEIRKEVFSVYRITLPFLLIMLVLIFLLRKWVIAILFTKEFASMEHLFAYQLIGDFLKTAGWLLGYLLIAKSMSKVYITMEIVNFVLLTTVCYFLVHSYGAIGATLGYAIVYGVYFIVLCFVFRNTLFSRSYTKTE